jgi:hypothetical protein
MEGLEGTWELAEAEELLGDSLFFSGAPGSVVHYRLESELGKLLSTGDWWADYRIGTLWLEAAKIPAARYPAESRAACEWSLEHFQQYARDWAGHLPASRWDSDGASEMEEVNHRQ